MNAQLNVRQRYRIEKSRALRLLAKDAHSDWMDECVPELMAMGKDQLVAVAACLNMWRQAWEETHPDGADDPGPDRPQKQLLAARGHLARAWDESEHPRDEDGKFTDSGGDGSEHAPKDDGDYSNFKTMPSHIEGVSITKKRLSGTAIAVGGSSGIALNTSRRTAAIWKDMAGYQKKAFESGWSSSSHPNHIIWHELAHVRVKNENDVSHDSYLTNIRGGSNSHFKAIASKVSQYAGTNGHEFLAETYAALRAGRTFDDDVLSYYKHLKGPKV